MKYRRLTQEELEALTDEFINFLIVHGIDSPEWIRIKGDEPVKAIQMIDLFSDFIFDGIVRKVRYIDYFDDTAAKLFKCEDETIHLIALETDNAVKSLEDWQNLIQTKPESCFFMRTSKSYKPDRGAEIFRMISAGGIITQGEWYEKLLMYV